MNDKVVGDASMGSTGAPLGQAYDFENSKSQLTGTVVQGKAPPRILAVEEVWEETANKFSIAKKWTIISVIFMVQVSMNFNTSLYSNAITGMSHEFDIDEPTARLGAMVFLVMYAFGCEIWAPFSEEFGRKPVIQLSLLLVNIFQIPVAVATNFPTVLAGRALGGLSTAGGSVTLGMIADMWQADEQQYAVAFVVFSSVAGSVFGPIVGGFVQTYCPWRWNIWIQLIFGMAVQALHFFLVPETRCTNMANTIAKNMRKTGADPNVYGPTEQKKLCEMFTMKELVETWLRPFKMFVTDPIVSSLSLLSGFSDALIFMFIQSFGLVYKQWHFNDWQLGLAFIPILIGYVAAWLSFLPAIARNKKQREAKPEDEKAQYESRLWWLLYTAPCLPIGLFGFAWTIQGTHMHWVVSLIFSGIVGVANYSIYMATIDYMVCAYGEYSASATGGNGFARDLLAGVLTMPAVPFFSNIGDKPLRDATLILFAVSIPLVGAVFLIYWFGPTLRRKSSFAQHLKQENVEFQKRRESIILIRSCQNSVCGSRPITPNMSRRGSVIGDLRMQPLRSGRKSPIASRQNSTEPAKRTPIPKSQQSSANASGRSSSDPDVIEPVPPLQVHPRVHARPVNETGVKEGQIGIAL